MSQKIAPGKWDAVKRLKAKAFAPFVGFAMICLSAWLSYALVVKGYEAGSSPTMVVALIALLPGALGAAALFPNIVTPILYRIIDRGGKDDE